MNDFKAVLIDIDNTLLDFDASARLCMEEGFAQRGITLAPNAGEVFTRINNGLWKQLEHGEITKQDIYDSRWSLIFKELGVEADGTEFELYFRRYIFDSTVVIEGAMELLEYLAAKYPLYVASNGIHEQQINRLTKCGMLKYIKDVFTSQRLGVQKPEKEFFTKCLELMNCSADDVIMIGDSLNADIKGGNSVGIKTLWFNQNNRQPMCGIMSDRLPWGIVDRLEDIKRIL